jgi:hypothetical protein
MVVAIYVSPGVFLAGVLSGGVYHVIHTWPKFRGEKGSETQAAVSEARDLEAGQTLGFAVFQRICELRRGI